MSIFKFFQFCLLAVFATTTLQAQTNPNYDEIVEVAGVVFTQQQEANGAKMPAYPVSYATLQIVGTSRGTYANFEGMFSIVVKKGQQIKFSAVGYADAIIDVPANHEGNRWAVTVELKPVTINLDVISVLPWPNRNNLTAEFLAMRPNEALQMQAVASQNLEERQLLALQKTFKNDSRESASYYLHKQARDYGSFGQLQAMPVFDPLVWARFLKQEKDKKKRKEQEEKERG
jgi:hypothetical protein